MRVKFLSLCTLAAAIVLVGSTAWAQSSGSFTYANTGKTTGCMLDKKGNFTGGQQCIEAVAQPSGFTCSADSDCTDIFGSNSGATCVSGECKLPSANSNNCIGNASAIIKSSSGSGNVLDIRPSAVIGLLTDVTVKTSNGGTVGSSSAEAGIDFTVSVFPLGGQATPNLIPGAASTDCTTPDGNTAACSTGTITYDARFVEISTNLFQAISTQCDAQTNGCYLTFAESTTSAHSFDWIAGAPSASNSNTLSSGDYGIEASWGPSTGVEATGIAEAAACVGAVNLTVEQNKMFNFNSANTSF